MDWKYSLTIRKKKKEEDDGLKLKLLFVVALKLFMFLLPEDTWYLRSMTKVT
jgi:hypothetical protein